MLDVGYWILDVGHWLLDYAEQLFLTPESIM